MRSQFTAFMLFFLALNPIASNALSISYPGESTEQTNTVVSLYGQASVRFNELSAVDLTPVIGNSSTFWFDISWNPNTATNLSTNTYWRGMVSEGVYSNTYQWSDILYNGQIIPEYSSRRIDEVISYGTTAGSVDLNGAVTFEAGTNTFTFDYDDSEYTNIRMEGDRAYVSATSTSCDHQIGVLPTWVVQDTLLSSSLRTNALKYQVFNTMTNMAFGKTEMNVFDAPTSWDAGTPPTSYTRNTDCWAYDIDLSCASPWNSTDGRKRAGTLISPRHFLTVNHFSVSGDYEIDVGAAIHFVGMGNELVSRTVQAVTNLAYEIALDQGPFDISIYLLDSDVPASITFAKIPPRDWLDYLPELDGVYYIAPDQVEDATVQREYQSALSGSSIRNGQNQFYRPVNIFPVQQLSSNQTAKATDYPADLKQFHKEMDAGDSGGPLFMVVNGEAVFCQMWVTTLSGSTATYNFDEINELMTVLGGGYQLTEADWSGFYKWEANE